MGGQQILALAKWWVCFYWFGGGGGGYQKGRQIYKRFLYLCMQLKSKHDKMGVCLLILLPYEINGLDACTVYVIHVIVEGVRVGQHSPEKKKNSVLSNSRRDAASTKVLCSIPASCDTVESERRQMKQWLTKVHIKKHKNVLNTDFKWRKTEVNTMRFWLRIGSFYISTVDVPSRYWFRLYSIKYGIFRAEVFSYGKKQCCGSVIMRVRILFLDRSGSGAYPKTGPSK